MHPWFILLLEMAIEFFKKRIGQRIDEIRQQRKPFEQEDVRDLEIVRTYMIFKLRDIFGRQIGREDDPQDQGQGNTAEAFGRLIERHGRVKIFNNLLEVVNPDLEKNKDLFNQYKAAVNGILNEI